VPGFLAIVLHAHLPFVRHPDHEQFLEERWLFEAVAECYLPLLEVMEGWRRDRLPVRLTLSLSPTLASMLRDPLLQERCGQHLQGLVELAEKEMVRTRAEPHTQALAGFYRERFTALQARYESYDGDLVSAFGRLQVAGLLDIIPTAATHALLPVLLEHPPALRAQVKIACAHHRACFGREPHGFWLPECAYAPGVESILREENLRWFVVETAGLLNANPRPKYAVFAPIFTPAGVAAFGRDPASARQVWSRSDGYPGDPRYRDFYRDIGFDLDADYLKPHLPPAGGRTFTGLKYHRITGPGPDKQLYDRHEAVAVAVAQAGHFLRQRLEQGARLATVMPQPPILVAPYDAELFGHWWFEGPEFLDGVVRQAAAAPDRLVLLTPADYLRAHPTHQLAVPAASSWGDGGDLRVWRNEKNEWVDAPLRTAREEMTRLARAFPHATGLPGRLLQQAGRELLLAEASDWPFILTAGTSPGYARGRFTEHLSRFDLLRGMLQGREWNEAQLRDMERQDNLFPDLDWNHWS
jgi:1,4-alpha-glucan branching enzyme